MRKNMDLAVVLAAASIGIGLMQLLVAIFDVVSKRKPPKVVQLRRDGQPEPVSQVGSRSKTRVN
jgi:hypothetical protein